MFFSKSGTVGVALVVALCSAAAVFAQTTRAATASTPAIEFPVMMRQKVEAGKTPVGTKIQAKLTVATLVNGIVIPQDATLSGKVIESALRTANDPSRLAICLESAEWKNGSAPAALTLPFKIYLTEWYYPLVSLPSDFPDTLPDATHSSSQRRRGGSPYPDPNTKDSPPYAPGTNDKIPNTVPTAPSTNVSQHRELMKNVELTRSGGVMTLTSMRSNIKLDKSTTYVFAASDLGAGIDSR